MADKAEKMAYLNKELDEANDAIFRQHEHIKWFVKLYLIALSGFFTLCGYFTVSKDHNISEISVDIIIIILVVSIIVFVLGWILLSVIGHKIATLTLLHKQVAYVRKLRREKIYGFGVEKRYVYPLKHTDVRLPSLINTTPYVFFALNYTLLGGTVFFLCFRNMSPVLAYCLSVSASLFIGLFYHKACISFNKHTKTAKIALSVPHKLKLERKWANLRKVKNAKLSGFLVYAATTVLFLTSLAISFYSRDNYFLVETYIYVILSTATALVFASIRYSYEKNILKIFSNGVNDDEGRDDADWARGSDLHN